MENPELKVTSGAEWRKMREEGTPVQLPTGRVALLRPVTIESLLLFGKVPDKLTTMVAKMIREGSYVPKEDEDIIGTAKEFMELSTILLAEIFLSPKIVAKPKGENEITFFDVSPVDREYAIGWAQAPLIRIEPFRGEENQSLEFAHNE
jgi:hypothetical protein